MSLGGKTRDLVKVATTKRNTLPPDMTEADFYEMVEFKPRHFQQELLDCMARFSADVVHRRAGKSVLKIVKLLRAAVSCPFDNGRYAYTGPTQEQVKDIAWHYFDEFGSRIPGFDAKETKREIWVPTIRGHKSRIKLYGVDNPKQRLRGLYLDGAVLDEYQHQPEHVFTEQMRPMLSDANRAGTDLFGYPSQWTDFIGTPFGRNQFYRVHKRAEIWASGRSVMQPDPETNKEAPVFRNDWAAHLYRASETGIIPKKELQDALADMGRSKYLQEYECSWDAMVEGSVYGPELEALRLSGRITNIPINPHLPVHTAWDLGWDDATAIWFFQQIGSEYLFIDYYEVNRTSLPELARILADKGYAYGDHYLPHDVEVTEQGVGKSRRAILTECGVRVTTVPRVKVKHDAVFAGQAALPFCYFDEARCQQGLDALALYRRTRDERLGRMKENPEHDWASHAADAFQQFALGRKRDANTFFNPTISET